MIPSKVKVAGVEYQVKEVPFVEIDQNKNYLGACKYSETTIEILSSLSEDRKEQTFVHELLHAIFNEAGYSDHDEDMVNRIGIILHQVLKDNKLDFSSSEIDKY